MANIHCIQTLDVEKADIIRSQWIELTDTDAENELQLRNSFFDHMIDEHSFGEVIERSNLSTNLSSYNTNTQEVEAIVEIIFSRQGAKSICKVMDVIYAPIFNKLDDDTYIEAYSNILISALTVLLQINLKTKHGLTKIFARNDMAIQTISHIHKRLPQGIIVDGVKFNVEAQGRHWLMFEKVS